MNEKEHNIFYKTTNSVNGKFYYGIHSTNNLEDGYLGSGITMLKAIKKYGKESFTREIVADYSTRKEASEYESRVVSMELVKMDECYNLKTGGDSGFTQPISETTRAKMRESHKGRILPLKFLENIGSFKKGKDHPNYGKKLTDEQKEFIGKVNRGKIVSEDTRKKMSNSSKFRTLSKESREKQANSLRGKFVGEKSPCYGIKKSNEMKSRLSLSSTNVLGCIICNITYRSIVDASKTLLIPESTVSYRIKSTSPKWLDWKYKNKED